MKPSTANRAQTPTDSTRNTRERVKQLTDAGHTPRDIALLLGISTQRVYQQKKKIEESEAAEAGSQAQEVQAF